ncbi:MAG: sporulation protein YqfD [Oscillibacter sp.]
MLKKAVKLLRGSVCVRAKSAYPERMLNLCSARGIEFWDVRWIDDTALSFCVARGDLRALRRAAEGCGAEVSIERTAGTPFFFARLRRRHALFAGGILCAALLLVNSLFIWDFEVTGNETVPTETILHALREHGVHRGTFIYSFRSQDICNRVLPELKDLCWVAVNVRGCKAYVQVRERVRAPERVNESEPTNVIAAKPGLITKVRALDGEKRVLPGTSVQQGQLLIAGVVDTGGTEKPSVTTRFLAGKGEVWARTWYDLTVRVPLTYEKKVYTGKEKRSHTLIWGENRLKIGAKGSSICNVDCDKIKNQTQWTLFGLFALPVTWETETLLPYELEVTPRSRADAEAQGKDMLETYLDALLGEAGSVTQRRFSTAVEGDTLVVTLSAECEEQIGKEVPIAVSEG